MAQQSKIKSGDSSSLACTKCNQPISKSDFVSVKIRNESAKPYCHKCATDLQNLQKFVV